ncbi:MAG: TetR/AcrR family transcriptional regulator [Xanthobacteraceae bacterium]
MAGGWQQTRKTFRHGDLPEALVEAALDRLESDGVESLSLRELASDVGVNHRAVYRHFPDKLSLLARVAQSGWQRLEKRVVREMKGKVSGDASLIAGSIGFFRCAHDNPNLFTLMSGPRLSTEGTFPELNSAIGSALHHFEQAFLDAGTPAKTARLRTAIYIAALTGIIQQVLHGRLHVVPSQARGFVADACKMLIKGLR